MWNPSRMNFYFNDFTWIFYVYVSEDDKKKIKEDLKRLYPDGYSKFDLYNYLKQNSCEYCLEYGHYSPTVKRPFNCPKVPRNFVINVDHLARKYNENRDIIAYKALKKQSKKKHFPGRYPNDFWTWSMLEDKLKEDKRKKAKL